MVNEFELSLNEIFILLERDDKNIEALLSNVCGRYLDKDICPLTKTICNEICHENLKKRLKIK